MKTISKKILVICCCLTFSSFGYAETLGSIIFTNGPTGGKGTVSGSGTYTVNNANWTVSAIRLCAVQSNGGTKYVTPATVGNMNNNGTGKWDNGNNGVVSITNLPPGAYTVYAELDLKNGLNYQTVVTATFIININ